MTKKTFEQFADEIASMINKEGFSPSFVVVIVLCITIFSRNNPRFSETKFLDHIFKRTKAEFKAETRQAFIEYFDYNPQN